MLGNIRKFSDSLGAKILLGGIILIFMSFGLSGLRTPKDTVIAIDGDSVVTIQEFTREKRNMAHNIMRNYPDVDLARLDINKLALNELIRRNLMKLELSRLGIKISDDLVVEQIKNNPLFFDENKKFSKDRFNRVLAAQGMQESVYVEEIKNIMGTSFLTKYMDNIEIPDQIVKQFHVFNNQTREVDLYVVDNLDQVDTPASDKEIEAFYSMNKMKFSVPEYRGIEYLIIKPDSFKDKAKINSREIDEEINSLNLSSLEEKKEARKRLIDSKIEAAMFESIKSIEDAVASGEPMKDVAAQFGLRYKRLPYVNSAGFDSNNNLNNIPNSSKFMKEAFELEEGMVSEALPSENGGEYYMVGVFGIKPSTTRPLEEVKNQIANELNLVKARSGNMKFASEMREKIISGGELGEKYKTRLDVGNVSLSRPNNNETVEGIRSYNIIDIFNLKAIGDYTSVFQVQSGKFAFAKLTSIENPTRVSDRELNDVRPQVSGFLHNAIMQNFVEKLFQKYKVEVFEANIPKER